MDGQQGRSTVGTSSSGPWAGDLWAGAPQPLQASRAAPALAGCALRAGRLLAEGRVHQPVETVGRSVRFADGTTARVYRETVVDRPAPAAPAVLVVSFRLRRVRRGWAHELFRRESALNTVLFLGFPGFRSKLWLAHDEQSRYRGLYQWDGPDLALSYVRALWWPLAVLSEPSSIRYAILPGLWRAQLLGDPAALETAGTDPPGSWWRPVGVGPEQVGLGR